jgi:hypothetical protein
VSRESVQNCLGLCSIQWIASVCTDIRNAYRQAPSSQKDFIICGLELGLENAGKRALIH